MRKTQILNWLNEAIERCVGEATLEHADCHVQLGRYGGHWSLIIETRPIPNDDGPPIRAAKLMITVDVKEEDDNA